MVRILLTFVYIVFLCLYLYKYTPVNCCLSYNFTDKDDADISIHANSKSEGNVYILYFNGYIIKNYLNSMRI